MKSNEAAIVVALRSGLERVAVAADAEPMAAYLKGQFRFLGVKTPARRSVSKPLLAEARGWDPSQIFDVAEALMAEPEREYASVACDLVRVTAKNFEPRDLVRLHRLITTKSWWDTVDALAVHGVGVLVKSHRHLQTEMDVWVQDRNVWVARTAILHQLLWKGETDAGRLFRYCDIRGEDTEFFIRKALGWALRHYARTDPEAVRSFVLANDDRLSSLTKREALKYIS